MSISKTFHQRYVHLLQEYVKPQGLYRFTGLISSRVLIFRKSCFLLTQIEDSIFLKEQNISIFCWNTLHAFHVVFHFKQYINIVMC